VTKRELGHELKKPGEGQRVVYSGNVFEMQGFLPMCTRGVLELGIEFIFSGGKASR